MMAFWALGSEAEPVHIENVTQSMYEHLRAKIPDRYSFYLTVTTNTLTLRPMISHPHESLKDMLRMFTSSLDSWVQAMEPDYWLSDRGTPNLTLYWDQTAYQLGKQSDFSLRLVPYDDNRTELVGWVYPQVVVEVGYSETYKQLVKDAEDWLLASNGQVLTVLVFKWKVPWKPEQFTDLLKWGLFLEIYERCVTLFVVVACTKHELEIPATLTQLRCTATGSLFYLPPTLPLLSNFLPVTFSPPFSMLPPRTTANSSGSFHTTSLFLHCRWLSTARYTIVQR
jgi:hypothetical protein